MEQSAQPFNPAEEQHRLSVQKLIDRHAAGERLRYPEVRTLLDHHYHRLVSLSSTWMHSESRVVYKVTGCILRSDDGQVAVLYRPHEGYTGSNPMFDRPLGEWEEVPEGRDGPRFVPVYAAEHWEVVQPKS